jgi:hypothetical protein
MGDVHTREFLRWHSGGLALCALYGAGPKAALRVGMAAWVVFWAIPLMAMAPLDLFPNRLLFLAIGLGLMGANLGSVVGAWLYRDA